MKIFCTWGCETILRVVPCFELQLYRYIMHDLRRDAAQVFPFRPGPHNDCCNATHSCFMLLQVELCHTLNDREQIALIGIRWAGRFVFFALPNDGEKRFLSLVQQWPRVGASFSFNWWYGAKIFEYNYEIVTIFLVAASKNFRSDKSDNSRPSR